MGKSFKINHIGGRVISFKIASRNLTCWMQYRYREDKQKDMKLFETSMLAAYETHTTKRGYVTVKLNKRKAKRVRFNQGVRDIFAPIVKVFAAKGEEVTNIEDFAF